MFDPLHLLAPAVLESFEEYIEELVDRRLAKLHDAIRSPWLSATEAANYLGWPRKRVYNKVAAGAIPHRKNGSRLLFRRDELDAWLNDDFYGPREPLDKARRATYVRSVGASGPAARERPGPGTGKEGSDASQG